MLPLLAFLAFVWFERSYLQIVYYDFTSQLEPQHRVYNLLWCALRVRVRVQVRVSQHRVYTLLWCARALAPPLLLQTSRLAPCRPRALLSALPCWCRHLTSPSMPLAVWAYFFNPRIFTDLPRWPGMVAIVPTMLISNGLLLYCFHRNTQEYIGSVSLDHSPELFRLPSPAPLDANMCVLSLRLAECTAHTTCSCATQVRWLHGVWLVWRKPRDLAARGKVF